MSNKAIEALKLAQNQLGASRLSCEPDFDRPLWDVYQAGIAELAAAGNSQSQDADQLYKVIRGFGYTTSSQTSELVAAIAAMGKQEGGDGA